MKKKILILIPAAAFLGAILLLVFKLGNIHLFSAEHYYNTGKEYYFEKQYESAIEEFSAAIDVNPKYCLAYLGRAYCYEKISGFLNAIADYCSVIDIHPDSQLLLTAYSGRASCYIKTEDYQKAIPDIDHSILLSPHNYRSILDAGELYLDAGKREKAYNCFRDVYNNSPENREQARGIINEMFPKLNLY
jgi:tetratricopeptide (TPR) repeat protein